jgi:DNA adenine methylase
MGGKNQERLFMWAGGKSRMIPHYLPLLGEKHHRLPYIEPFAGGAAMFQHMSGGASPKATLSDINLEIVDLYRLVKSDPQFIIKEMKALEAKWLPLDIPERKALYYELRQAYWATPEGPQATALLYFLMKTGFNGIWQTCKASNGRYGTPVGLANQKTAVFSPDVVLDWHSRLANTDLLCAGYDKIGVDDAAFIYCDPPYRDSFTTYGAVFGDDEQVRLIEWCRKQHEETGSIVWLCNRDAGDGFFEKHAPEARMHRFPITYTAGRRKRTEDGFEAKKAVELLLTWG